MDDRSDGTATCPRRRRFGKWLGLRLALVAGSLALTLVCGEIAVRLFTDVMPGLTEKDAVVGQRYLRSFSGQVFDREARRKVAVRFNDEGFRGPNRPRTKPPGVRRVAVLGDSMVASLGVDEPQTMVCQLETLLNESQPEVTWEVMNFGVNGASPGQEMVLYREVVASYEPDLVLCMFFVGNDLADGCRRLSNNPRIYFDVNEAGDLVQEPSSARRTEVSRLLNRYSRFYAWQRTALNLATHQVRHKLRQLEPGEWIFSRSPPPDVDHAWQITTSVFRTFRKEVETRGSRLIVVMIPSAPQIYDDVFTEMVSRAGENAGAFDGEYPDQRMAEICRATEIPYLSLVADFRAAAPSRTVQAQDEWLYLQGVGHFNEQGNALAARAIHQWLVAHQQM